MAYDVKDFQKEVIERSKQIPVLVDFWAEWCSPCRILGPVLERLATSADGRWQLAKVNTEEMPEIAARYNIRSIPNVKLFVDGSVSAEFVGALPEPMVRQWLEKHLPSKLRSELQRAEELLSANKAKEARPILERIVAEEPNNHKALVLLAQTYLYSDHQKALHLIRAIEADSPVFDVADAIRTFASLLEKLTHPEQLPEDDVKQTYLSAIARLADNDVVGALEGFIQVIRNNRYYDEDGARKACVAIFKILGEEHDVTKRFRREFSRALY
ncbi:MAG: thioredoxin [Ignavibacteria bacterium]